MHSMTGRVRDCQSLDSDVLATRMLVDTDGFLGRHGCQRRLKSSSSEDQTLLLETRTRHGSHFLCASSLGDESACHPKPKYLRQVERSPFNAGATIWRTTTPLEPNIFMRTEPQDACVRPCYPMRQNPQKCCLPCRLGTIIDFRVSGRHFAPALAKRSVKQTPYCLAAHGEHTALKKTDAVCVAFQDGDSSFPVASTLEVQVLAQTLPPWGLLKRCFLVEVLFPARTALCKI